MLELADAVIVGGGVMGVAIASELSRRHSRVLLVEADRCGSRATYGGFAWVNASSKWQNEHYHRLNALACTRHLAMAAEWDPDRTGWHGGGTLSWTNPERPQLSDRLDARIAALQEWGYPMVRVDRSEMEVLEPNIRFESGAAGVFMPSEGWVDPPRLVRFYLDQARERRAEIAEFTTATGFTVDYAGAIASIETTAGRVSTRILVICAGIDTGGLTGLLQAPEHGSWLQSVRRTPGLLVETETVSENAQINRVCFPGDADGLHLRPTGHDGLLIGADDTDLLCSDQRSSHSADSSGVRAPNAAQETAAGEGTLVERVAAILPGLDTRSSLTTRVCSRPVPTDGFPIVGPLPGIKGVYMLVSHSGMTLAPLLAPLLAEEIITGRPPELLAPYRPARFHEA